MSTFARYADDTRFRALVEYWSTQPWREFPVTVFSMLEDDKFKEIYNRIFKNPPNTEKIHRLLTRCDGAVVGGWKLKTVAGKPNRYLLISTSEKDWLAHEDYDDKRNQMKIDFINAIDGFGVGLQGITLESATRIALRKNRLKCAEPFFDFIMRYYPESKCQLRNVRRLAESLTRCGPTECNGMRLMTYRDQEELGKLSKSLHRKSNRRQRRDSYQIPGKFVSRDFYVVEPIVKQEG